MPWWGRSFWLHCRSFNTPTPRPFGIALQSAAITAAIRRLKSAIILDPRRSIEGNLDWPNRSGTSFCREILDLFGPLPAADLPKGPWLHWLTGLIVFCDWIASNTDWFPLHSVGEAADVWNPDLGGRTRDQGARRIGWHRRNVLQRAVVFGMLRLPVVPTESLAGVHA